MCIHMQKHKHMKAHSQEDAHDKAYTMGRHIQNAQLKQQTAAADKA